MHYKIKLSRDLKNILVLENYIQELGALSLVQKNKLTIICTELFDNIVNHTNHDSSDVTIRFNFNGIKSMLILFKSKNMNVYMTNIYNARLYYDSKTRKYRGMGVKMCYNLSASIHYRITENYNAISVVI